MKWKYLLLCLYFIEAMFFFMSATNAFAAPIDLADEPLGAESQVPPNIWMTVDDSSSMTWTYAPDNIESIKKACWASTNAIGACPESGDVLFREGNPPMLAAAFNGLAYDPLVDYLPPSTGVGSRMANITDWTKVQWSGAWKGRPGPYNLKTASYSYSATKYQLLQQRYMAGVDVAIWNLFTKYGSSYRIGPHYYKTNIMWCRTTRSRGDAAPTSCRDDRDDNYQYPYYSENPMKINGSGQIESVGGSIDNTVSPAFELVVLDYVNDRVNGSTGKIKHRYYDENTGAMAVKERTAKEELQNYANWLAYYSSRLVATKTAASHAFADIDIEGDTVIPRVALSSINRMAGTPGSSGAMTTLNMDDFGKTSHRDSFFKRLLDFTYTGGGTPLQGAMIKVGETFRDASGPIVHACQRNYHILFTDGLWNQSAYGTTPAVGNVDGGNVPAALNGISVYGETLASGTLWPDPVRDYKGVGGTLSDIALKYWMTDLRADMANKVIVTNKDPATWQHLNFIGMGFGVRGTLPSKNQQDTIEKIKNRTLEWPKPTPEKAETVDDLWHASINGLGRYVAASSPEEFRSGLRSILAEILNLGGARSGIGFTHPDLTGNTQSTYTATFTPGWNGDVIRKRIDDKGNETSTGDRAAEKLEALLTPDAIHPEPWKTRRKIFTRAAADSLEIPFTFEALSAHLGLINHLGNTEAQQKKVIAYLRGDQSGEGDTLGKFRIRGEGPLGDIVNARPVVVITPYCQRVSEDGADNTVECNYEEETNPGYRAFYDDHENRATMIYVAANDGMVHAFDERLNEKWAYMPMALFRPKEEAGIVNLTFQEADINNPFRHYSYVDATPRTMDAFINGAWRTVLVGGLGKGGTSYYALDVTDAGGVSDEANGATQKGMWEFTDPNMGYSYGRPIITKTRAWDKRWVAVLPSGYNNGSGNGQPKNGDGKGHLFFVDLADGKLLYTMDTGMEGSPDNPIGMAYIGGYVETYKNQETTAVYGGDQRGGLWRFNLESDNPHDWYVTKMAELKDSTGNQQWVTTEPWPQLDKEGNRWAIVGTGGFRNNDDLTSTTRHTLYAFRDGGRERADTFTDKTRDDLTAINGISQDAPDLSGESGWYEDMAAGYHINISPVGGFNMAIYAANKYVGGLPTGGYLADLCDSAVFDGRAFARMLNTGESKIMENNTLKDYVGFSKGIADIALTKRINEDGDEKITISVSSPDGSGLDSLSPSIDISIPPPGSAGNVGRINIRYIGE